MTRQSIFSLRFILALLCATGVSVPLVGQDAPPRGYQARPCGLDMNRNAILGEPEDCRVCDGTTLDPDYDGVLEDMLYIDCDVGIDNALCGSPAAPCRSIQYAWNTRADGPDDGAEDILCFRGTCLTEENTTSGHSGVPGHYIRPRQGSEARDWEYPSNPTMLVGWDSDADGQYPPYDQDDVAVLDGGPNALARAFHINHNGRKSYTEMAHFTARDYGRYALGETVVGFIQIGRYGPVSSHGYLHDLQLERINRGRSSGSATTVINLFRGGTQPQWWAFENINVVETASWVIRGSAQDSAEKENGPYRFKNFSVSVHGCPYSQCGRTAATTVMKLWGYVSRIEVLDSIFDLRPDVWEAGGNPSNGISPAQCSRDWTIRNNEFIDFQRALNLQVTAEDACDAVDGRTVDDVVFDRNIWFNTHDWGSGDTGIKIEAGHSLKETAEDLYITNNVFFSTDPIAACFWSDAGNPNGPNVGTIHFVGNSCIADIDRFGAVLLGENTELITFYPQQNYVIKNNLFTGISSGGMNVLAEHRPENLQSDNNIFDPDASFQWTTVNLSSLAEWQNFTDGDTNSRNCVPTFKSSDDFHLHLTDTCAVDRGAPLAGVAETDVEWQPRGLGDGWDIGADEVLPAFFFSDFESGDTDVWSAVVP